MGWFEKDKTLEEKAGGAGIKVMRGSPGKGYVKLLDEIKSVGQSEEEAHTKFLARVRELKPEYLFFVSSTQKGSGVYIALGTPYKYVKPQEEPQRTEPASG
jgi:hypothetical protein